MTCGNPPVEAAWNSVVRGRRARSSHSRGPSGAATEQQPDGAQPERQPEPGLRDGDEIRRREGGVAERGIELQRPDRGAALEAEQVLAREIDAADLARAIEGEPKHVARCLMIGAVEVEPGWHTDRRAIEEERERGAVEGDEVLVVGDESPERRRTIEGEQQVAAAVPRQGIDRALDRQPDGRAVELEREGPGLAADDVPTRREDGPRQLDRDARYEEHHAAVDVDRGHG